MRRQLAEIGQLITGITLDLISEHSSVMPESKDSENGLVPISCLFIALCIGELGLLAMLSAIDLSHEREPMDMGVWAAKQKKYATAEVNLWHCSLHWATLV